MKQTRASSAAVRVARRARLERDLVGHYSVRARAAALALGLSASTLLGCTEGFDPPSEVRGLRVLAVRSEPASGVPGGRVQFEMLRADAPPVGAAPREVQVAWLGGCHAPANRHHFACYPLLVELARRLPPRVLDAPAVFGVFGSGERFELQLPDDLLERSPRVETDPIHFAPSYVFFAACAGELVPRPDLTDRVPLGCVSLETREPVPSDGFVIGFATLFTFEGAENHHPRLDGVRFGGALATDTDCADDGDCADDETGLPRACSAAGRCAPRVEPCPSGDCPRLWIEPVIARDSAELLPGEGRPEVLWVNFFANAGELGSAAELVNDRTSGWIDDHATRWLPPPTPVDATLWVSVHDQRGGAAFRTLDVLVR